MLEIDVYLRIIRRWLWLMVLTTVLAAGISFVIIQRQPTVYVAQAELLVGPGITSPTSDLNVIRTSTEVMLTYAELAKTRNVLQQVVDELHLDFGPNFLAGMVTVTPSATTQVLNIAVRSENQSQAIAIANSLANALVRLYSETVDSATGTSAGELNSRMSQLQEQSKRSQARIVEMEAGLKTLGEAVTKPPFTEQENRIKDLEAKLAAPTDPVITKRIQDRQARIQQLELALKSTTSLDARRLILDEIAREDNQLASDKAQVNDQKRLLLEELGQERNRLVSMQTTITQQQNQILNQLAIERTRLADTERSIADLYTTLQNSLSRQIVLLDAAVNAPPESGKSTLIMLVATIAGLVLGLTMAFAFDYLDDRITTSDQLGQATGVQVWASLGKQNALLQTGNADQNLPAVNDWRVAEAFRRLCLKLTPNGSSICSLLVTNFESGDTAAEIASNLAITFTRAGKRVILVDADVRHPTLGRWFHVENKEGLIEWLTNGAHEPKILPVEWAPGLSILPVGRVRDNSTQELVWPRMQDLIERVENQTDILIIAGPPLSSSADSFFLASHVGGVLPVAEKSKTRRKAAGEAIESLRSLGIQILGLILADGGQSGLKAGIRPASLGSSASQKRLWSSARAAKHTEPPEIIVSTYGRIIAPRPAEVTPGTGIDGEDKG